MGTTPDQYEAQILSRLPISTSDVGTRVGFTGRLPRNEDIFAPAACDLTPVTSYVICTNPRSGSWLLSEGLASTSLAGNPREWFNIVEERQRRSQLHIGDSADSIHPRYLDHILKHGKSSNGIFGIKLHYYQFAELPSRIAAIEKYRGLAISQLMSALFPNIKYIWLTRRDKSRQAISYHRACKTDEWWLIETVTTNRRAENIDHSAFDPHVVRGLEEILLQNDRNWQLFFKDNDIAPLIVEYEDLAVNYAEIVRRILKWLAIPNAEAVAIPPPRLKRQSDLRNEEWLVCYRKFKTERVHQEPDSNVMPDAQLSAARASSLATEASLDGSVIAISGPSFEHSRKSLETIPDAWKQWIGRNKLLRFPDHAIIDVLTRYGYDREMVAAEVAKAASDPYLLAGAKSQQSLNKVLSLLGAFQKLASLDPQARTIERRANVSRSEFFERYYAANRPVIIQGLMNNWGAMSLWTPQYLKNKVCNEEVEIMVGRNADSNYEVNSQSHRKTIPFAKYVDMVYSGSVTNDYYMVANNSFFQRSGANSLLGDFKVFTEYLDPVTASKQSFLWFGPAGTVTPLHHDQCNIFLAQVLGRKRLKLIPANQWEFVYNNIGVFSEVDCEKPDLGRWPQFRNATIFDIVLEPGEVLFMPVGWWHHVRTLDVSMMISFTNFVLPNHYAWSEPGIGVDAAHGVSSASIEDCFLKKEA